MDKTNLDKTIAFLDERLRKIHVTGGGNLILGDVICEVYSSKMRIQELGTISTIGNGSYSINLWDPTIVETVKKTIFDTLGLNANIDGNSLKVTFPAPTQEKRVELSKMVSKYAEEAQISVRNYRRELIDSVEKDFKDKLISEDDKKRSVAEIENLIKTYGNKIDEMKDAKIKEINTI